MTDPRAIRLPPVESAPQAQEADAGRLLQMLWRGKWFLIAIPALAVLMAKLWLGVQTEIFQASALVQVDAREVNPLRGGAGDAVNKPRTVLKQQQGLLRSTSILKRIADSPEIQALKTFAPERLGEKTLVGALFEGLTTGIDVESDRLSIQFVSPYRREAELVVAEALRVYLEYQKEKKREEVQGLAELLRTEWDDLTGKLNATREQISTLRAQHLLPAGTTRTPLEGKLDTTNQQYLARHQETIDLRAAYEDLRVSQTDPERFRERGLYLRSTKPIGSIEERAQALERERQEKEQRLQSARLGDQNPEVLALRREIEALREKEARIPFEYAEANLRSAEIEFQKALVVEKDLTDELDTLQRQLVDENRVKEAITDLEAQRNALLEQVNTFAARIGELGVLDQTGGLNLDVVEAPRAAVRPIYPESEKTLIYAVAAGIVLAFGLVMLIGLADRSIRNVMDVPALLNTSVVGVLPQVATGLRRGNLARAVEEQPQSLLAEAVRSARTATSFALPGGKGCIVVTSAETGDGKSTCASNLACAFARAGRRVLLIDADMRAPTQHLVYEVANAPGLAGLLSSAVPVKKAVATSVVPGLDLLPSGEARGRAAELCEGRALRALLDSLRESYDCVVIDAPAVLETSEARVLAALADATLFVLRLEQSSVPSTRRAAGILRGVGARLVGCLVNGERSRSDARAFAGGITYGTTEVAAAEPESKAPADEPTDRALGGRALGTDFLGISGDAESA